MGMKDLVRACGISWVALAVWATCSHAPGRADEREDFFEAKIRPILAGTCFTCHGGAKTSGEFQVDSREKLLRGGESGPAIVPGKPAESLLIQAISRQEGVSAMPPEKDQALRADQVADFTAWIKAGAVWPAKTAKFEVGRHWAFVPVRDVPVPKIQNQAWAKTSIDFFIRAKQEQAGVRPAPAADKLTLLRRATFDLTGLPPTPEEVAAFLADSSPGAFEAVVDRLLNSPAYGERWGRHWLDVVRYADTAGETADFPVPLAWRYRNYVIDAFNADKPFDEFLREQIAGDVLAAEGPREKYAERVVATGYLALSRRFGFDSENYHHLTIQDTIDTLGQSVLGLSIGCARCHDHKFDALSMHDYYALYGIFASSRYPFPGSEQKQKMRSLAPLVPPGEAQPKWREFEARVATLGGQLARKQQPVPAAVLRSLGDLDGDFELQAAASGGSNGVLVSPWLYDGNISVTNAAQSPFTNVYPPGRVGVSIPAGAGKYRITQALHPRRTRDVCDVLHVNFDLRVAAADASAKGMHRLSLIGPDGSTTVELLFSAESLLCRQGDKLETLAPLKPNEWNNLQLAIDVKAGKMSGRLGPPGAATEFSGKPLLADSPGIIDAVVLDSLSESDTKVPGIEYDNLGIQEGPFALVSTTIAAKGDESLVLKDELTALMGRDGDLELQTPDGPPASPWNPGPNSVVKAVAKSQSPFQNIFPPGDLGFHMPNRGEYDGFGLVLPGVKPDTENRLFVSFDFRCANKDAGGSGSWRYYLGHGPGNSAAVELFFNGSEFFRRSGDAREAVATLAIGQWYQVQLKLDLAAKTYRGVLASRKGTTEFTGKLASGWDGEIDYSFIDSYGHLGGVRPALDADNFAISDKALPAFDAPAVKLADGERLARRKRIEELRQKIATTQGDAKEEQRELNSLLAAGPFDLAYGMAEGTPHNVRLQMRGEPDQPGAIVPRGFVKALGGDALATDAAGSGRLALAKWLTRPDNPLTARVMANRIWQYHFGQGLVKTSNDFGVRGLPPTHPELLDHLASEFVRRGWSIKAMHRLIILSATYRQSSVSDSVPAADLYVAFARRRLSAEEIRDALLAVSGEIDRVPGREHPFPSPLGWGYTQHGPFSAVYDHHKRSVYLMTQRLKRHPFLALFDGADPNATTAQRFGTTVPTQALFFLNDPFVHKMAEGWAARLRAASADESQQIETAWRAAVGRAPTSVERAEAADFLAAYRAELKSAGVDNCDARSLAAYLRTILGSNEFLHVD